MIDTQDLTHLFSDFIIADSNPFNLTLTETFKEGGEVKSKEIKHRIDLIEVSSPTEVIFKNSNTEIIDYYPKTWFKKIFNIKNLKELPNISLDENSFVFMSEKTSKIFKTESKVYNLEEDDKIIIGKRSLLIIFNKEGKTYAWSDPSNYKTILIR